MKLIQLEKRHFEMVSSILKKFGLKAFVFGSRSSHKPKKFSDLDLCLMEVPPKRIRTQARKTRSKNPICLFRSIDARATRLRGVFDNLEQTS